MLKAIKGHILAEGRLIGKYDAEAAQGVGGEPVRLVVSSVQIDRLPVEAYPTLSDRARGSYHAFARARSRSCHATRGYGERRAMAARRRWIPRRILGSAVLASGRAEGPGK